MREKPIQPSYRIPVRTKGVFLDEFHYGINGNMGKDSRKIETGSKVAIIGGGPAGSFFALYLMHYAE